VATVGISDWWQSAYLRGFLDAVSLEKRHNGSTERVTCDDTTLPADDQYSYAGRRGSSFRSVSSRQTGFRMFDLWA
jgi:hypothetical protein